MSFPSSPRDSKKGSSVTRRPRKRWVVPVAVIALMLITVVVASAALPTIDDFDDAMTAQVVNYPATYSATTTGANILGGERNLYVYGLNSGAVTVEVSGSSFKHSQNTNTTAKSVLTYDGSGVGYPSTNATGLGSVDLTSGGTRNGFHFYIARLDWEMDVRIKVYSSTGTSEYFAPDLFPYTVNGSDVVVPFAAFPGSPSFSTVGAIEFEFIGASPDTDLTLGLIETTALDWGDLPDEDTGGTHPDYPTKLAQDGPRHVINALILGGTVDPVSPGGGELNGQPSLAANGDDNAQLDDENGVEPNFTTPWSKNAGGAVKVEVNGAASVGGGCLSGWVDWTQDGDFDDTAERIINDVEVNSDGTVSYSFLIPRDLTSPGEVETYYARFRLYPKNPAYAGIPAGCKYPKGPTGVFLWVGGEVEDYRWAFGPTAVNMIGPSATAQEDAIEITWDTVSEVNNLGFNLYRAASADDEKGTRINAILIPAKVGNPLGNHYSYVDRANLVPGTTYVYWLEDVSTNGTATRHDPLSVLYTGAPTAVGLAAFGATTMTPWPAVAVLLSGLGAATVVWWRKRQRTGA